MEIDGREGRIVGKEGGGGYYEEKKWIMEGKEV